MQLIQKGGYNLSVDNKLKKKQNLHIRTNCLDCLDRTNFIQSKINSVILKYMLNELGISIYIDLYT